MNSAADYLHRVKALIALSRRRQLAAEIREARAAYAQGDVQRGTVGDLFKAAASRECAARVP